MPDSALPPMPEPLDYCYEWDGPFGTRKFSTAPHNGRKCDRSVPLFTADQLREVQAAAYRAGMEAAAVLADDIADATEPEDFALDKCREVATAIRSAAEVTGSAGNRS